MSGDRDFDKDLKRLKEVLEQQGENKEAVVKALKSFTEAVEFRKKLEAMQQALRDARLRQEN